MAGTLAPKTPGTTGQDPVEYIRDCAKFAIQFMSGTVHDYKKAWQVKYPTFDADTVEGTVAFYQKLRGASKRARFVECTKALMEEIKTLAVRLRIGRPYEHAQVGIYAYAVATELKRRGESIRATEDEGEARDLRSAFDDESDAATGDGALGGAGDGGMDALNAELTRMQSALSGGRTVRTPITTTTPGLRKFRDDALAAVAKHKGQELHQMYPQALAAIGRDPTTKCDRHRILNLFNSVMAAGDNEQEAAALLMKVVNEMVKPLDKVEQVVEAPLEDAAAAQNKPAGASDRGADQGGADGMMDPPRLKRARQAAAADTGASSHGVVASTKGTAPTVGAKKGKGKGTKEQVGGRKRTRAEVDAEDADDRDTDDEGREEDSDEDMGKAKAAKQTKPTAAKKARKEAAKAVLEAGLQRSKEKRARAEAKKKAEQKGALEQARALLDKKKDKAQRALIDAMIADLERDDGDDGLTGEATKKGRRTDESSDDDSTDTTDDDNSEAPETSSDEDEETAAGAYKDATNSVVTIMQAGLRGGHEGLKLEGLQRLYKDYHDSIPLLHSYRHVNEETDKHFVGIRMKHNMHWMNGGKEVKIFAALAPELEHLSDDQFNISKYSQLSYKAVKKGVDAMIDKNEAILSLDDHPNMFDNLFLLNSGLSGLTPTSSSSSTAGTFIPPLGFDLGSSTLYQSGVTSRAGDWFQTVITEACANVKKIMKVAGNKVPSDPKLQEKNVFIYLIKRRIDRAAAIAKMLEQSGNGVSRTTCFVVTLAYQLVMRVIITGYNDRIGKVLESIIGDGSQAAIRRGFMQPWTGSLAYPTAASTGPSGAPSTQVVAAGGAGVPMAYIERYPDVPWDKEKCPYCGECTAATHQTIKKCPEYPKHPHLHARIQVPGVSYNDWMRGVRTPGGARL